MSARTLHVYLDSHDLEPSSLRAGRDLVLAIPTGHGLLLPEGVLIDDHLDLATRQGIDRRARQAISAWRERFDGPLFVGSISLSDIWHSELYAEVFVPTIRVLTGVQAAARASDVDDVVCHGLDEELVAALSEVLAPLHVTADGVTAPPRYPSEAAARAAGAPVSLRRRLSRARRLLLRSALRLTGVPTLAWGQVLVLAYGPTIAVMEELVRGGGPRPVVHLAVPPSRRLALRAATRGGWTGIPGFLARRRAAACARRSISAASRLAPPSLAFDGGEQLLHSRALRCLCDRALETTAIVPRLTRVLNRSVRVVLLPFDDEPEAKIAIRLAQQAQKKVTTVSLQHGYEPLKIFYPGSHSDMVGVWSGWDRDSYPPDLRSKVRVVGNPGKRGVLPERPRARTERPRAVVLVASDMRTSALLDRRTQGRMLAAALAGLAQTGLEWETVIRPHPSESVRDIAAILRQLGAIRSEIDERSPITELLATADVVIGTCSTATLEAAALGARVVMLNVSPIDWAPPLNSRGSVPYATDAEELARELDRVMRATDPLGAADLLRGLGFVPADPAEDIVEWLAGLSEPMSAGCHADKP